MSTFTAKQLRQLQDTCVEIAEQAGQAILHVYTGEFDVDHKADNSPLTQADIAAHQIIAQGLSSLEYPLPVLSEESSAPDFSVRSTWPAYWLVDPLDGTREFVKRNGEFTVNIALIEHDSPILGVVHAPVTGETWSGSRGNGAWKHMNGGETKKIHCRNTESAAPLVIAQSRSHPSDALKSFMENAGPHETISMGSSIKLCIIAEGKADLYPRLGPTSEWDTAAAHAVLKEAGGDVTDTRMNSLRYNTKDSLLNPHFFAIGKGNRDWSQLLPAD